MSAMVPIGLNWGYNPHPDLVRITDEHDKPIEFVAWWSDRPLGEAIGTANQVVDWCAQRGVAVTRKVYCSDCPVPVYVTSAVIT